MENTNNDIIDIGKHRRDTVIEILKKLQEHDRVCCVRYTGYGKTYYIIKQLIDMFPNKQFLIFVPAKSLIKRYKQLFLNSNVIIKTYQSLLFMNDNEIADSFSNIDYMICDEAHRLGKNKWRQSIKNAFDIINSGNTKIVGLTATPKRGDKIDIVEDFFNGIETSRFDLLDGIQAGYIPKIDYVVAYCDLSGFDKEIYDERMEDVDRYEIDNLLNVSNIIKENIPKNKLKENLKIVLYISRLKDMGTAKESCYKWFTEAFPNKSIRVFSLSSEYADKENNDYLDEYSDDEDNNSIDIMVSCNKLNEGLHLPKCSIAILLRKTTSPIVYFQQIGRTINGSKPVVFDLVDNSTHIKQIENDFECGSQENLDLSIQSNRDKKIFSECINLISMTKDIENILNKFKFRKKIDVDECKNIYDLYKNNHSIYDIANILNVPLGHVNYVVCKYNKYYNSMRFKKIDDSEAEEIITLYTNGMSMQSLAKKFKHSPNTIKKIIPKHLLRTLPNGVEKQNYIDKICNMYDGGASVEDIALNMNKSPEAIRYSLVRYSNSYKKHEREYSIEIKLKVCNMYKDGYTMGEIRKEVNMGSGKIREILKEYNIPSRKPIRGIRVHVPEESQKQICKLYEELVPVTKIAKEFNLSICKTYRILSDNNIKLEGSNRLAGKPYKPSYTQDKIDEVVSIYENTGSIAATSRKVNLARQTVVKILNFVNINN